MKKEITGTWKLMDFELRDPRGNIIHPFEEGGMGICIIDPSGYMSAQLMRCDRPGFASEIPTPEEAQIAYLGYVAYYGKVVINEQERTLVTRVEGALNPDWVGTDQLRHYTLLEDRLVLKTPPMKLGGVEFTGTLSWRKVD